VRVYIDSRINTLYIEGVTSGPVTDFTISKSGDLISIYRISLQEYELANVDYRNLSDQNGNPFPDVNTAVAYLTSLTVYQGPITAVYPLVLDPNNNYLSLLQEVVTDGGNF
jgi:hypothetical protein